MAFAPPLFLNAPPRASIRTSDVPVPTILPPGAILTLPPFVFVILIGASLPVIVPATVVPPFVSTATPVADVILPRCVISFAPVRFTECASTSSVGTVLRTPVEVTLPAVLMATPSASPPGSVTLPTEMSPARSPPMRILRKPLPSAFFCSRPVPLKISEGRTSPAGEPPPPGVPKEIVLPGV